MRKKPFSLHPAQQDVFTDQLINLNSPQYNIGGYIILKGFLNKQKFHEAVNSAPRQFDAFKMRFDADMPGFDGHLEDSYDKLEMTDLDFSNRKDPAEYTKTWMQAQFNTAFEIKQENLLFDQYLIKIADDEHWFFGRYHHLITDGYGFIVWVQYVAGKYRSLLANDELVFSFPSYQEEAVKAADYKNSVDYEKEGRYWKEKITTKPEKFLQSRYSDKTSTGKKSSTYILDLNKDSQQQLKDIQLTTKSGLQQLTIAALLIFFGKTTEQREFIFGVPIHKRNSKRLRNIVGMFSGILPYKGTYQSDTKLGDFLKEIGSAQKQDYRHQNYSIGDLSRSLKINFSEGYLYDVVINYEPLNFELNFGDELQASIFRLANEDDKHPLQLSWRDYGNEQPLQLHIHYLNDYFTSAEIELLAQRVIFIIGQYADKLDQNIERIDILPPAERGLLLHFNQASVGYPKEKSIVSLFEEQVLKTPAAPAIGYQDQQLSYKELNSSANRLANQLRGLGVKEDTLVPICIGRSTDMIIGILGILKAGGAYVPIDPEYPAERIGYMLKDTNARVVISSKESVLKIPAPEKFNIILLDEDGHQSGGYKEEDLQIIINPRSIAYVIYTSGSTGTPKGVMVEHYNVVRLFENDASLYDFTEQDVWTMFHSFCFDFSVWEMYGALFYGGRLVIVPREVTKDVSLFGDLLIKEGVTILNQTPSAFYNLQQYLTEKVSAIPVRYVIFGGEALTPSKLHPWKKLYPACRLINMYGITETTVHVTFQEINWQHINGSGSIIGKPIPTLNIYILNAGQNIVPVGVSGEIYVGGAGIARGYLNRPGLTAERFVNNPFSDVTGSRLYKTGDLGRWLTDGNIEYLGRIDEQVKIRGYRIELGEIETVLAQGGMVTQSVVIAREDDNGNKRLIGYVVPGGAFDKKAVIAYLKNKLPEYMVPVLWVEMESLPLTPNGKIDRKALPDIDAAENPGRQFIAPGTQVQLDLATVWQDLLNVDSIGIEDNFFEMGGDSIIAIQVISRLKRLGYSLQPKDIFIHQTISNLSSVTGVHSGLEAYADQQYLSGASGLLPIQQWYFQKEQAGISHYNQSVLLKIDKSISLELLQQAFVELIAHHDALRFTYTKKEGLWHQEYGVEKAVVTIEDLSTAPANLLSASISEIVNRHQRSLDIIKGHLVRVVWMKTPGTERDNRLFMVIHHLAVDGVSWRILLEDLQHLLNEINTGGKARIGNKTSSYRQWFTALEKYGQSRRLLSQKNYWSLAVKDQYPLPADKAYTNDVRVKETVIFNTSLNAAQTRRLLQEVPRVYHTEINDILLTALAWTLIDWTKKEKVIIGLEGHGREDIQDETIDISRTVGWFTSLYPVVFEAGGAGRRVDHWIKGVKEQLRRVPARGLGYGVLKYINKDETLQGNEPWDIIFNYLGQLDNVIKDGSLFGLAGEASGNPVDENQVVSEKLSVDCHIQEGELIFNWRYSHLLYQDDTIKTLATEYLVRLEKLIDHCLNQGEGKATFTPSDYGLGSEIGYEELDSFLDETYNGKRRKDEIEGLYRLSSLQQGMLFHGLYDGGKEAYIEQFGCDIIGLDQEAFAASWTQLLQNHTVLRSAFYYDAFAIPVQCVYRRLNLPLEIVDYRNLSKEEQELALKNYEDADLQKGFDFKAPPLMRIGLIRLSGDRYRMIWTSHHILFDGWSLAILMEEFLKVYELLISGKEVEPTKEDRYEDYIRYLENVDYTQAETYWSGYLKEVQQSTLLPFIKTTSDRLKGLGTYKSAFLTINTAATSILQEYAQANRLTVNTIIQGVWSYLLHSYTGNQNIVFGVIVSGRTNDISAIETRVGMFINTLPLHSKKVKDQQVVEWLQQLQVEQVSSRQYQHMPLQDIQVLTQVQGDLFDSLLVFENYPVSKVLSSKESSLQFENIHLRDQNNYPLTLTVGISEEIIVDFRYNASLLEDWCIKEIKEHFEHVLVQVTGGKAGALSDIELLTPNEKKLLAGFNDAFEFDQPAKNVKDLFEEQVAKTPGAIALVFKREELTFNQLNERSNQLANYLRHTGVQNGVLVPLLLEAGIEMIVAILGVLKAGGAYVPIDPAYPVERIRYMLQDIDAGTVLTTGEAAGKLQDIPNISIVELDADLQVIHSQSAENLSVKISPRQLAYIIYTSGSTGTPKGVMIEHGSLANYICNNKTAYISNEKESAGSFFHLSYTFDASLTAIFMPLVNGKSIVIGSKKSIDVFEEANLWKYAPYDFIKITPSHFELLQSHLKDKNGNLLTQKLVVGGEALHLSHVEYLVKNGISIEIINEYGPTEATVGCSTYIFNTLGDNENIEFAIPIGKPIDKAEIYIVGDDELRPIGVAGEICISGAGLARGYLNQPELTAEKFAVNPFGKQSGSLFYKSGDLGRWLPDGNIEYLGRKDDQVKIRGYRIELGEIESGLLKCELVKQAVVLAIGDKEDNKRLVGFIVPEDYFDKEAIAAYLMARLPEYMVPSLFIELQNLPLTTNGKIDRKALSNEVTNEFSTGEYIAAGNETEEKLAEIWKDLLELDQVGVNDDFFELGGHSLLAVRVISAIRRQFEVELTINEVFDFPTIALMATRLKSESINALHPAIKVQTRPEYIPLSFSQERLWFIHRLEGSLQYHVPAVLSLKGRLNKDALTGTFQTIINRHEVLRTIIREQEGQGYQAIMNQDGWKLSLVDGAAYKNNPDALQFFIQQLIRKPFDLSADYMLRASLINLDELHNVLVVTMHHIASDAWSMSVIVKEVVEIYSALIAGRTTQLPQLDLQYADYAIWQRNYLQGDLLDKNVRYWKEKLEEVAALQLPTDFLRPAVRTTRGASASYFIEKRLLQQMHGLSQQQGTTLFMTLLATFKVLLYRYSGQQDISVGTSIGNRSKQELESLVGFFVNTLALRSEVKDDISFTEFLQQVKVTTLEAYEHQELPFEKVVETVIKERDATRSPLFQVMLVLLNTPEISELRLGEVELTNETFLSNISKFDITFFINETAAGLQVTVEYSTDLYKEETILRMLGHFNSLLGAVVKTPHQRIGLLPLLTPEEEYQLVEAFNEASVIYPKDKSIVALFEEQVEKTPGNTAVVFEGEGLTYLQLQEQSNQLAHHLRQRGVTAGSLVPLYIERSLEMMIGLLGILKAGGAYVPIDTDFPADRISYMLKDTGASLVVSSKSSRAGLQEAGTTIEIIELDNLNAGVTTPPPEKAVPLPAPQDLAYVIYTSGSTGTPKGVMIEHRNLVDYVFGLDQKTQATHCRSFALVSTIATDLGNTVIYSSLLSGGALHLFSKDMVSNAEALHRYFKTQAIECLKIVPSHWKALCQENKLLLPTRLLVFGGEALQAELVEDIKLSGSACMVVNHYGPTETTIGKLLHVVNADTTYTGTIPIGKPFSNTRVYVLSPNLQLCPVGVLGQLYISGDGVARGYMNNTELTKEKFINNPFSTTGLPPMYGTGDLVKWLPDGNILFAGRVDDQVKIRGYRVELGEIESILQRCELVSQAVVLAREDKQGNKRLAAYIVAQDGWFDREGILDYVKEKLPEYMVPSVLMELESLPLTANGKIDRKALPDPDVSELLGDKYVAPRNAAEETLAIIWQDVLEVEQVGIHDDFFELGGHSLLAIRLISAIRKQMAVELPISDVFDYPTIATLAGQLQKPAAEALLPVIEVQARPEHIPLSFSQERLWFIDRLEGSIQYHVPAVLRLKGKLDKKALSASLQEIINRHEVLRTVILEKDGQPYQIVKTKGQWELETIEATKYRDDAQGLQHLIEGLVSNPFDLAKDYMLRASLLSFSEEDNIVLVTLHHIASDGWSKSVFVRELVELYDCYVEQRANNLPALPVQYADYAIWQRRYLEGEILDTKLAYWKTKLDGVQPLQLPTDFDRPPVWTNRGNMASFNVSKDLSEQLQALSYKQNVTMFMSLVSVFKILLFRYSGQHDICVGTPVAGRPQEDLEGLIGFFVNTLALRSEVSGEASFAELLQQVRVTTMEAYGHQEVPFEKVVDSIVKERDVSRNPLFQVMFILRNTPEIPELRLGEVSLSPEGYGHKTSMFDIAIFVTETSHGLEGSVEYNTDLYKEETILRLVGNYKELLKAVVENPYEKIGLLPLLTKEERHQLLVKFNHTRAVFPQNVTIIDLFETQASLNPEAVAVVFEQQQITYRQLNERSNQLAHFLQQKGVKEETLVPVCISRRLEMIIGILGILKAGGAYVAIDPEYPLERINYMLKDTGAAIILSSVADRSRLEGSGKYDIIEIDGHWPAIKKSPADKIQNALAAHHLAYVIYTSGSTGRPKGVMIEHHSVHSFICWCQQEYSSSHFEMLYATTSICFDLSVFEIFYPLSIGKPLRIIESGLYIDKFLDKDRFVLVNTVPSVIDNLLQNGTELNNVSVINMAGEPIPMSILHALNTDKIEVRNLYGPTEDTTYSTVYRLQKNEPILIGKPIANKSIYIIDISQNLVPLGAAGEICITGDGLARGYLNRKDLTAEKFVSNPFSDEAGARMYKTGDLGRWLPDGNIEYLGRIDNQVKIRGYRIELGEIENALQQMELINQSVVLAKQDKEGFRSLVSYYVPDWKAVKEKEAVLYEEQVANWKALYETEYQITAQKIEDEEFDIGIWNDSFTGDPIATEQMQEWLDDIVDVIIPEQAGNVLEIGCGTGLIFYRLAGKVTKYIGTDFSSSSVGQIRQRISKGLKDYGPTELQVCAAHEVSLNDGERVDTVLLNSIIQYFPGEGYMNEVIAKSMSLLQGSGRIIIGDVRDNRLLKLFKSRLQLQKLQPSASIKDFKWAVEQEVLKEEELCFSPDYFYALKSVYPQITHVDIQWKQSTYINELTLYRYNVVIYVGVEKEVIHPPWQHWDRSGTNQNISAQLQQHSPIIAIKNAPNYRLWQERLLNEAIAEASATGTVADLVAFSGKRSVENEEINEVLHKAHSLGYHCSFVLNEDPLLVNIVMQLHPAANFIQQGYSDPEYRANAEYTNVPLFNNISFLLQKDIRVLLQETLPDYMVPAEFVALSKLPLTANGKIDRQFLSEREDRDVSNKLSYVSPRTELESKLSLIWQELLGVERLGILDNFFEMGGHSLLGMRLISAIRKELEVELAIKDLFTNPTIAALAGHLALQSKGLALPAIEVQPRPGFIPLSFSQERLWFIDQLGGSIQYHLPFVIRLKGQMDRVAMKQTLQAIVHRHETLRTVILEEDGKGYQYLKDYNDWNLEIIDGSAYQENTEDLHVGIQQMIYKPFDLSKDYMIRGHLIALNDKEHILVVTMHHIASDAWSLSVFVKEIIELYSAYTENRAVNLPLLPIQYTDYAIWQRRYLEGETLEHILNYWKEKLKNVTPLQLPTDYARPAVSSTQGNIINYKLDKELSAQLHLFSQQNGVTLFMTMLAGFKVLLHRYSNQKDICIGSVIAGRQQQEVEELIGFFVNTLALRSQVNGEDSFTELLQQVKITTLEAYEHQQAPFENLVHAVVQERDMSRHPLFQVMFVLQNAPDVPDLRLGSLQLIKESSENRTSKFDLTFTLTETAAGLQGSVQYCTDLYGEQTIRRMISHYEQLLKSVLKMPGQRISRLNMLTPNEERLLIYTFNDTVTEYPKEKSIIQLFEEQVQSTPGNIALVFDDQELTYKELNERSNQLAHYLNTRGVGLETLVPVCIERSTEMMIAILGILKAGGAYVPIDLDYPEERIRFMLLDTSASVIVSTEKNRLRFDPGAGVEVIRLDTDRPLIEASSSSDPQLAASPGNLAYIIYTSGSTGRPKGVMVEHRNVVSLVKGIDYVALSNEDVLLSTGSSSFDATTFEYWGMLLNGGKLVLCSEGQLMDNELLKEQIRSRKVKKMWFTSSWFNQLVDTDITIFEGLETLLVGGEKLSVPHIERMRKTYPFINIVNGYGPTENTTFSLTYPVTETEINRPILIGRPLSNRNVYIVDSYGGLVPVGVTGEICLAGAGLARGYLNNKGLTNEKFVLNPYSREPGATMYRTGDLGCWLPDGHIEYLGRVDEQVKIRGYRIEPGEIETVLGQGAGIKQCVVMAREDKHGRKRLVAYVVPEAGFNREAAVAFLRERLPEYMVPAQWLELESLPLTSNGKIDRKFLPDPDISEVLSGQYVAPRTFLEENLTGIWQQLLNVERIGIQDNFFELGGDSILAIQLMSRTRQSGYKVKVADVFSYQTISQLAAVIEQDQARRFTESGEQGYLAGESGLLPVQQWYLEGVKAAISHFNQSVLLCINKGITETILNEAIEQIAIQHDALRFKYFQKEGIWQQEYGSAPGKIISLDLRSESVETFPVSIMQHGTNYQQSLDIGKGDIFRVVWVQTPAEEKENRLMIIVHHLAIDGVSWRILLDDLDRYLTVKMHSEKIDSGFKGTSYREWFKTLEKHGQSKGLLSQRTYWENAVKSFHPLPVDMEASGLISVKETAGVTVRLAAAETRRLLQEVPRVYHTEINDILLCALAITLSKFSNSDNVVIGLEGHGRENIDDTIDINRTIGWFTSIYPLLLNSGEAGGPGGLIKAVKEQLRQVPGRGLGYGILRYINREATLQGKDPWNIQFNYLGQLDNVVKESKWLSVADEKIGSGRSEEQEINEKISVNSYIRAGELILNWTYSARHYRVETIKALADDYIARLTILIEHCIAQGKSGVVFTPSDYGLGADITYEELDAFLEEDNTDNIMSF